MQTQQRSCAEEQPSHDVWTPEVHPHLPRNLTISTLVGGARYVHSRGHIKVNKRCQENPAGEVTGPGRTGRTSRGSHPGPRGQPRTPARTGYAVSGPGATGRSPAGEQADVGLCTRTPHQRRLTCEKQNRRGRALHNLSPDAMSTNAPTEKPEDQNLSSVKNASSKVKRQTINWKIQSQLKTKTPQLLKIQKAPQNQQDQQPI